MLQITSDRNGETERDKKVPAGTTVLYLGHVVGGMVRVLLPDGTEDVMHPACFPEFRSEEVSPSQKLEEDAECQNENRNRS